MFSCISLPLDSKQPVLALPANSCIKIPAAARPRSNTLSKYILFARSLSSSGIVFRNLGFIIIIILFYWMWTCLEAHLSSRLRNNKLLSSSTVQSLFIPFFFSGLVCWIYIADWLDKLKKNQTKKKNFFLRKQNS